MADPGEGLRGPGAPPLFLDQNEARRAEKKFSEAGPLLISGSGWPACPPAPPPPPPPLYLKVWIRHWDNLVPRAFPIEIGRGKALGTRLPLRVSLILQWVSDFPLAKMSKWSHFKLWPVDATFSQPFSNVQRQSLVTVIHQLLQITSLHLVIT